MSEQLSLFDAIGAITRSVDASEWRKVPTDGAENHDKHIALRVATVIGRAQRQSYERSGSTESFDVWIAERV